MEDFNVLGNKGRFSQAMETMVKTYKNIAGCFRKVSVTTALFSFMKGTGSFWAVKKERIQRLEVNPDEEESVKDAKGHIDP